MKNKLTILGSGTCVSSFYSQFDFRNPPAYLLQTNGVNILLDCSEGVRARLNQIKFDFFDIDVICISHIHPDHFNLETLLQSMFARAIMSNTTKKLTICGPKNTKKLTIEIWNMKNNEEFFERHFPGVVDITFIEYEDGKTINFGENISVTPSAVFHRAHTNDACIDSFSLRFECNDKVFTYSGDTGICDGVIKSAQNADIFLCEAGAPIGRDSSESAGHLNPAQAGEVAKNALAKHLILTHYGGKDTPQDMLNDVKNSHYTGNTSVATDYQEILF